MRVRNWAGQERFRIRISTLRNVLMGQVRINKKKPGVSVIGTKKPSFSTFPKMLNHPGQAQPPRTKGKKTRDTWTVR